MDDQSGQFIQHSSCEACGSSDANAVYTDHSFCFSCQAHINFEEELPMDTFTAIKAPQDVSHVISFETRGFAERRIERAVADFFDVRVTLEGDKIAKHYYPYTQEGQVSAYKVRTVEGKQFSTMGDFKNVELFGQSKFSAGGRKVIITEGEIDCLAVAQASYDKGGKIYPVVSIPSGASSQKAILANLDWLRSFEQVILMMDNDVPGLKGQAEAAKLIGSDKVFIAKLKHKDPSDSYLAVGGADIYDQTWNAQPYAPAGVINLSDATIWDDYTAEREAVYTPFPSFCEALNRKIFGRRLGSICMFTSGTGSGKTSFLREDAYHLLNTTDDMIGICSLEESVPETMRGFISLKLNKRVGIPGVVSDIEEERAAWDEIASTGRLMAIDHQGSVENASLLDQLEFLAKSGCKYIYLDHITIAVSDSQGSENQAIDHFMSSLLKICKRHNVWFGVVSHLRKTGLQQNSFEEGGDITEDDLKGSGSLKQISAQIIALQRNKHAENPVERHTVKIKVLKDRFGGDTGFAGGYRYSQDTGRLTAADAPSVPFEVILKADVS